MQVTLETSRVENGNRITQYGCRDGALLCSVTMVRIVYPAEAGAIWTLIVCATPAYPLTERLVVRIKRRLLDYVPMRPGDDGLIRVLPCGMQVGTLIEDPEYRCKQN